MTVSISATAAAVLLAVLLDRFLGEPARAHPLVWFGRIAQWLEARLNSPASERQTPSRQIWRGALAWLVAVLPLLALLYLLTHWVSAHWPVLGVLLDAVLLYLAIGWQSMREHIWPIERALLASDEPRARQALSLIVSRDTAELDQQQVATAACESLLENSSDALFASLFWYALGGPVMVIMHRLANTLDAMWGYRSTRFLYFGRLAARLDDVLNFFPAQLTALGFALLRLSPGSVRRQFMQGWSWKSLNAGAVMASGASALGIQLGGGARYHGEWQPRATLGQGRAAAPGDLSRGLRLVDQLCLLWLLVILLWNIQL